MSKVEYDPLNEVVPITLSHNFPDGPLYHYTTTTGALGILKTKKLWATHLRYLNDSEEFIHGLTMAKDLLQRRTKLEPSPSKRVVLQAVESMMGRFAESHVFVTSFSELRDRLSQWRGYSGASGVSFGFAAGHLKKITEGNYWKLMKCVYEDEEKEAIISGLIDGVLAGAPSHRPDDQESLEPLAYKLVISLYPVAAAFKNKAFFEECEWRMISVAMTESHQKVSFRTTPTMIIPYQEISLEQPIAGTEKADIGLFDLQVGPAQNAKLLQDALDLALDQYRIHSPKPTCSAAPYRSL